MSTHDENLDQATGDARGQAEEKAAESAARKEVDYYERSRIPLPPDLKGVKGTYELTRDRLYEVDKIMRGVRDLHDRFLQDSTVASLSDAEVRGAFSGAVNAGALPRVVRGVSLLGSGQELIVLHGPIPADVPLSITRGYKGEGPPTSLDLLGAGPLPKWSAETPDTFGTQSLELPQHSDGSEEGLQQTEAALAALRAVMPTPE